MYLSYLLSALEEFKENRYFLQCDWLEWCLAHCTMITASHHHMYPRHIIKINMGYITIKEVFALNNGKNI